MIKVADMIQAAEAVGDTARVYVRDYLTLKRTGGYVTILDWREGGKTKLHCEVGRVLKASRSQYEVRAQEAAFRLLGNPSHQSSYESRNPKSALVVPTEKNFTIPDARLEFYGRWGGAVRGHRYIWSVHGFTEYVDEAAAYVLALKLGDVPRLVIKNPHLASFVDQCR